MAAISLQAFAIGLIGFSFVKILAPAFFARQDTRTPVKYALIALTVNFVLSVSLAWYLTRIGFEATHAGLALATSVAAVVNAWLLYYGLRKEGILAHSKGWAVLVFRLVIANLLMTVCLVWLQKPLDWWIDARLLDRSIRLGVVIAAGIAVYFGTLLIAGLRPSQFQLAGRR
jgi:putative peptidoglycan lipid II flippase